MNKIYSFLLLLFLPIPLFAEAKGVEMADTMRANGKIYVVVATLALIFIGIVIYMFLIDRRIRNLEKERK